MVNCKPSSRLDRKSYNPISLARSIILDGDMVLPKVMLNSMVSLKRISSLVTKRILSLKEFRLKKLLLISLTLMLPESGSYKNERILLSDDFPEPFPPSIFIFSPIPMQKSMSFRTRCEGLYPKFNLWTDKVSMTKSLNQLSISEILGHSLKSKYLLRITSFSWRVKFCPNMHESARKTLSDNMINVISS